MIKVPENLEVGQHFYHQDAPDDVGIYRVRTWGDGNDTKTHLYVDSVSTTTEAIRRCDELNSSSETLDTKCD